jgi:tRNA-splicing ligase RtcB
VEGSKIRIMPDVHAGAGCVIGFTAEMKGMVIPNLIGVDIGCGMLCIDITGLNIDLNSIDNTIHNHVPAGHENNDVELTSWDNYKKLLCYDKLKNKGNFGKAIGSLGGGNHFIEINKSDTGVHFLVIHSGSRNMGKQVAEYYQNMAVEEQKGSSVFLENREFTVRSLKAQGRQSEIQGTLKTMDAEYAKRLPAYPKELCFLTGQHMDDYLHDMKICQSYASLNRETIANTILKSLNINLTVIDHFETVHNYINFKDGIMRKGAVSARAGERLIVPINMRDGSLICVGKGDEDWNYSAPHGAGRIMSRSQAKRDFDMPEYETAMDGIYTTCVNPSTLDESPMAYKPMEEIIANIGDTVDIVERIIPIYNFKAGE